MTDKDWMRSAVAAFGLAQSRASSALFDPDQLEDAKARVAWATD